MSFSLIAVEPIKLYSVIAVLCLFIIVVLYQKDHAILNTNNIFLVIY